MGIFQRHINARLARHIRSIEELGLLHKEWLWDYDSVRALKNIDTELIEDIVELHRNHTVVDALLETAYQSLQELHRDLRLILHEQPPRTGEEQERELINTLIVQLKESCRRANEKSFRGIAHSIPPGWTYLVHGTNLLRSEWNEDYRTIFSDKQLIIAAGGLSVISREELERGSSTTRTYSYYRRTAGMSDPEFYERNRELQIRVIFFDNYFLHPKQRERFLPLVPEKLRERIFEIIKRYYFLNFQHGRHPEIPAGTHLLKVAHLIEDDVDVLYYIPRDIKKIYDQWSA